MAEALRLADELDDIHTTHVARNAAAELRRLHEENASLIAANEAFGRRQKWWNERMVALEQQRDALLEALKEVVPLLEEVLEITDDPEPGSIGHKARAAIKAAVGGEKT